MINDHNNAFSRISHREGGIYKFSISFVSLIMSRSKGSQRKRHITFSKDEPIEGILFKELIFSP